MIFDEEYIKVRIDTSGGPDACWPWTGTISRVHGRGLANVGSRHHWVPRYVYEVRQRRRLAPNMHVSTTCGNLLCCNPAHLEVHKSGWRPLWCKRFALTANQVVYASHLWCSGELNQTELAQHFGVGTHTINKAVKGHDARKPPICRRKRPARFKKLNTEKVLEIRRRRANGASLEELAADYDVNISHISRIARNLVLTRVKERPTT